jgi:hypothetical protein
MVTIPTEERTMAEMTRKEMEEMITKLQAENAAHKAKNDRPITCKVAQKSGGCSVYGLGRFPVTLYKSQWSKLLASAPKIEAFLKENDAVLKDKE